MDEKDTVELFVPGRICLFGEHSDWAASYRRVNSKIEKGYTIICGTNQGLHARAQKRSEEIHYRRPRPDGSFEEIHLPLDPRELQRIAEEGGFWSYIAGVAYQVITHYRVGGVDIDNFLTDLPLKKGLSSSAAVCVLVARAFNRLYDLKMTVRGEMDMAYRGEITTPSRCGRMDQGCAYDNHPILMTFDGDAIDVHELRVGADMHYLLVDLHSKKDTIKILADLNRAYPFADSPLQERVQQYLGRVNMDFVHRATAAIEAGDRKLLGTLMSDAQRAFDEAMIPACPSQLTAPFLHQLLANEVLAPFLLGGKGVGSQGDGTAQLLVRDAEAQARALDVIQNTMGLTAYPLTIMRTKAIRRAVVTAAGFGTRLFPFTKVVRKEFMPVVDASGLVKPLIMKHVEELVEAGIERVGIIIQKADQPAFDRLFREEVSRELYVRLTPDKQEAARELERIGCHVELIPQEGQAGLGDAVLRGAEWCGGEPFLLVLGDHVFTSAPGAKSCAAQLLAVYDELNQPVLGLARTSETDIQRYGCVAGSWESAARVLSINLIVEKPSLSFAKEFLRVDGLASSEYLSVFGLYIIDADLVGTLRRKALKKELSAGELQLTDALEDYRREKGLVGVIIEGMKNDIGLPRSIGA